MHAPDDLLHMALPDDWAAAKAAGEYRVSTRGHSLAEVGFIHCSYPHQVARVANFVYADLTELVLLQIDPERLEAEVRLEPAAENSSEMFPHIYGPLPVSAVVGETPWHRDADGTWRLPGAG